MAKIVFNMFEMIPSDKRIQLYYLPASYTTHVCNALNRDEKFLATFLHDSVYDLNSGIYFVCEREDNVVSKMKELVNSYLDGKRLKEDVINTLKDLINEEQLSTQLKRLEISSTSYVMQKLLTKKLIKVAKKLKSEEKILFLQKPGENIICENKNLNEHFCPDMFAVRKCYSVRFQHDIDSLGNNKIFLVANMSYKLFNDTILSQIIEVMRKNSIPIMELVGAYVTLQNKNKITGRIKEINEENGHFKVKISYYSHIERAENVFSADELKVNLTYSSSRNVIRKVCRDFDKLENMRRELNQRWSEAKLDEIKRGVADFLKPVIFSDFTVGSVRFNLSDNPYEVIL